MPVRKGTRFFHIYKIIKSFAAFQQSSEALNRHNVCLTVIETFPESKETLINTCRSENESKQPVLNRHCKERTSSGIYSAGRIVSK